MTGVQTCALPIFLILGFVIFMFIRTYNKLKTPVVEEVPVVVDENILLLREIRDSLKKK